MKMKKKINNILEGVRNDYKRLKDTSEKEFIGGKRGKEIMLAQYFARIDILQTLLIKD